MQVLEWFSAQKVRMVVLFTCLMALSACVTNPPYQEMSDARQAINAAIEAGADKAEPALMRLANRHLGNAKVAMKERRFTAARNEATLAHQKATEALKNHQSDPSP